MTALQGKNLRGGLGVSRVTVPLEGGWDPGVHTKSGYKSFYF